MIDFEKILEKFTEDQKDYFFDNIVPYYRLFIPEDILTKYSSSIDLEELLLNKNQIFSSNFLKTTCRHVLNNNFDWGEFFRKQNVEEDVLSRFIHRLCQEEINILLGKQVFTTEFLEFLLKDEANYELSSGLSYQAFTYEFIINNYKHIIEPLLYSGYDLENYDLIETLILSNPNMSLTSEQMDGIRLKIEIE